MKNILLIMGGGSTEHDISLISAEYFKTQVDSSKFKKVARYTFASMKDFDRILCIGDVYSEFESMENITIIEPFNEED